MENSSLDFNLIITSTLGIVAIIIAYFSMHEEKKSRMFDFFGKSIIAILIFAAGYNIGYFLTHEMTKFSIIVFIISIGSATIFYINLKIQKIKSEVLNVLNELHSNDLSENEKNN